MGFYGVEFMRLLFMWGGVSSDVVIWGGVFYLCKYEFICVLYISLINFSFY